MKYKDKLLNDIKIQKNIQALQSMPGWKNIEEFIIVEESKLNQKLLKSDVTKLDRIRGSLDLLTKFKTFLRLKKISSIEAQEEFKRIVNIL